MDTTLTAQLNDIRFRNNCLEALVSTLRPEDETSVAFVNWSESMALLGQQFRAIVDATVASIAKV